MCCTGTKPIDNEEVDQMLESYEEKIKAFEERYGESGDNAEARQENFTGKVFIILNRQKDMHHVVDM